MPKIDAQITVGNMVSWALVLVGFIAGFVKLQGASEQNAKDVGEAKMLAIMVQDRLTTAEAARMAEMSIIKIDIAVIKNNMGTINDKLDEIRRNQKP